MGKLGLLFVVLDKDMFTQEVIGYVTIPYAEIENRSDKDYPVRAEPTLSKMSEDEDDLGTIRIKFEFIMQ